MDFKFKARKCKKINTKVDWLYNWGREHIQGTLSMQSRLYSVQSAFNEDDAAHYYSTFKEDCTSSEDDSNPGKDDCNPAKTVI